MSTALVVVLNVFLIAFVLLAIVGLFAWSIVSDRTLTASVADRRARLRADLQRREPRHKAPARRRPRRALDVGA